MPNQPIEVPWHVAAADYTCLACHCFGEPRSVLKRAVTEHRARPGWYIVKFECEACTWKYPPMMFALVDEDAASPPPSSTGLVMPTAEELAAHGKPSSGALTSKVIDLPDPKRADPDELYEYINEKSPFTMEFEGAILTRRLERQKLEGATPEATDTAILWSYSDGRVRGGADSLLNLETRVLASQGFPDIEKEINGMKQRHAITRRAYGAENRPRVVIQNAPSGFVSGGCTRPECARYAPGTCKHSGLSDSTPGVGMAGPETLSRAPDGTQGKSLDQRV
jgi:hypothetical protein